jgi:cytosine deaminase
VEALLEVKDAMKGLVEIQIVAFPQDAVYTSANGEKFMRRAMDMGCDVVGGSPNIEYTREDGVKQVKFAFKLAEEYGAMIDIHCDETGDEQSRFVEGRGCKKFCVIVQSCYPKNRRTDHGRSQRHSRRVD